jgi:hypothetical protein
MFQHNVSLFLSKYDDNVDKKNYVGGPYLKAKRDICAGMGDEDLGRDHRHPLAVHILGATHTYRCHGRDSPTTAPLTNSGNFCEIS